MRSFIGVCHHLLLRLILAGALVAGGSNLAVAQTLIPTEFTYQGQLNASGAPVNGTADFQFSLWNAASAGAQVGATVALNAVSVTDGLFTASLDFGAAAFDGNPCWVQIAVRNPAGSGSFITLTPRQPVTATPYALQTRGLFVSDTGEVGIGTTSPTQQVHIVDTVPGGISYPLKIANYSQNTGTTVGAFFEVGTDPTRGKGALVYQRSNDWNRGDFHFLQNSAADATIPGMANSVMMIRNDGVVGIGTTTPNSSFRLQTAGGSGVWRGAIAATGTTNSAVMGELSGTATIGGHNAALSAWTDLLINPGGGNVGIGTTNSPTSRLDVAGTVEADGFKLNGNGAAAGKVLTSDANGVGAWSTVNASITLPYTGAANALNPNGAFTINNTGNGYSIVGQTATGVGIVGITTSPNANCYGVWGSGDSSPAGVGVYGTSLTTGVFGATAAPTALAFGVIGSSVSTSGRGVYGEATAASGTTYGVYGNCASPTGYAVWAQGRTGASGTKSFRIDDPRDPENKYLLHYSTEAPEPLNTYKGTVELDANGQAWVTLPDYFAEINRDPHVQLTAVEAAMPSLHVGKKVTGNRFLIAGGAAGGEVYWRVEAVRNDRWVRQYGAPVEVEKDGFERGTYLHPELYGQPPEKALNYRPTPAAQPTAN